MSSMLLISHLDRVRYQPVVVLHREGSLVDHLDRRGIAWGILPLARFAGEVPGIARIASAQVSALARLIPFLNRERIDFVHTNDLRMHLTWSAAARLSGRPWIWHQRMLMSGSPLWRALPFVAKQVICISNAVRATLPSTLATPVEVIHNPVDPSVLSGHDSLRPELETELGLGDGVVLVGFVGNMTAQKRPLIFARAAAELVRTTDRSIRFLMFGDDRGGQRLEVEALARELGIADRMHFMGHRSPIEPWIGALDFLLAPGVGDGFGRTLVEAMVAGTPVVAVHSGGHGEIVEHERTGLLVPPDDALAMAAATCRLLADHEGRDAMVIRARHYARHAFAADRHARKVMALYDQVGDVGKSVTGETDASRQAR